MFKTKIKLFNLYFKEQIINLLVLIKNKLNKSSTKYILFLINSYISIKINIMHFVISLKYIKVIRKSCFIYLN